MRVAALALGILAGLVASLILALGGLDVAADVGPAVDRQAQAIRFGLFVIGNIGVFAAALALAAPLAAAGLLLLAAVAWVGAALLMHHTTDLVLITPPALLLVAAVFAAIAHFRRPRPAADDDIEDTAPEILTPQRAEEEDVSELPEGEEEVGIPAFATEARAEPSVRSAFDDDRVRSLDSDWNPRRRRPPPPRAKPAFRPIEDEYDDEPSGFARFAQGLSGVLSFGLYAALAGAAGFIFWSMRNEAEAPAVTVAEAPAVSSSIDLLPPPSSSAEDRLPSTEARLEPILTGEPIREVATSPTAPSTTLSELVAEAAPSREAAGFGAISLPDGPVLVPRLADDFASDDTSGAPTVSLPPFSSEPPTELPVVEPEPLDLQAPQPEPSVAAPGQPLPRPMPLGMAALRAGPAFGATPVAASPSNANNTGL